MIRIDIDQRILDREESADQLRRKLQESRERQAEANGYRLGYGDGFEAGMVAGRKLEQGRYANIYAAYERGDRS